MTCPTCDAPVADVDAFCEACGSELGPAPHVVEAPTSGVAALSDDPLLVWASTCLACGGTIDDDGFCATCGRRGTIGRDHWVETPAAWVGAVCDKGILHARNEDAMSVAATSTRALLVVCDGVTSAPDSDRASIAAARAARAVLQAAEPVIAGPPEEHRARWEPILEAACRRANAEAVAVAHRLGDPREPPSCTFVAAVVDLGSDITGANSAEGADGTFGSAVAAIASVAWCGDSRAYWLPDGSAGRQLGLDHSVGSELLRSGMDLERAARDPQFHTITRWLGADSIDPHPELITITLDESGWVLVCSDGMWNYADSPQLLRGLIDQAQRAGAASPTALAESMAAWANDQGGHDNITVALARFEGRLP